MKAHGRKWLLWLALAALVTLHGVTLAELRPRILGGETDFTAFYSAARAVAEGRGALLYEFDTQREFQGEFPARRTPLLFYHPPFELLLFLPLAWLPFVPAYAAWMGVNLGLLAWLAWLPHPYAETYPRSRGLLLLVLALAFFPVTVAMMQGQDSILLLLVFTLAWMAMRRGQSFRAGCILALGLFKFQFVLPFMAVLAIRRSWRALKGFLLTGLGLGLASLVPVGWQGVRSYFEFLLEIDRHLAYGTIRPVSMPNLRGLVTSLSGTTLPAPWPVAVIGVVSLLLLILAAWHWPQQSETVDEQLDLPFALNLLVAILVSYHLNIHDLTILFLFFALTCRHVVATQGWARLGGRILCACMIALFLPPMVTPSEVLPPSPAPWLMLILLVAVLAELHGISARRHTAPLAQTG
jgi:hypothetical protein